MPDHLFLLEFKNILKEWKLCLNHFYIITCKEGKEENNEFVVVVKHSSRLFWVPHLLIRALLVTASAKD
jgi:hypothetical protein